MNNGINTVFITEIWDSSSYYYSYTSIGDMQQETLKTKTNQMETNPQRLIDYVINYVFVLKNYIHEKSSDYQTINVTVNQMSTKALMIINKINKGYITNYAQLMSACSDISEAFFDQMCNDKDYVDSVNEEALKQREAHELPY